MKEHATDLISTVWNTDKQLQVSNYYTVADHVNSDFGRFIKEWADRNPRNQNEFAEQVARKLPIRFKPAGRDGEWYVYNGYIWQETHESLVNELISSLAVALLDGLDHVNSRAKYEIKTLTADGYSKEDATKTVKGILGFHVRPHEKLINQMQTLAGHKAAVGLLRGKALFDTAQAFKDDLRYLPLRNCVIDFQESARQKRIITTEHSYERLCTRSIDLDYNPEATAPNWVNWLTTSIDDREQETYLERALGSALAGESATRRLVNLQGEPSCGKSMVIRVLEDLFTDYTKTIDESAITTGHGAKTAANARHDLIGTRFAVFSEVEAKLDEPFIKKFTGGDTIRSEAKFKDSVDNRPQGTMFIASNVPLNIPRNGKATRDRLARVNFPYTFELGNPEHPLDEELEEKLLAEGEGILLRLLNGYIQRLTVGIDRPESMQIALENEREEGDLVLQFIEDMKAAGRLVINPQASASNCAQVAALYTSLVDHLRGQNIRRADIPIRKEFVSRIEDMGHEKVKSNGYRFAGMSFI